MHRTRGTFPDGYQSGTEIFWGIKKNKKNVYNDVKIATIANKTRENSRDAKSLEDLLYSFKLPSGRKFPFLTLLRQSSNYIRAAQRGMSIFEFAPLTTALDREYWKPLTEWLESKKVDLNRAILPPLLQAQGPVFSNQRDTMIT